MKHENKARNEFCTQVIKRPGIKSENITLRETSYTTPSVNK